MTQVQYKLIDVEEMEFFVNDIPTIQLIPDSINTGISVNLGWDIEHDIFAIDVKAIYNSKLRELDETVLEIKCRFFYFINDMAKHIIIIGRDKPIEIEEGFFAHLLDMSVGMLRGIIYSKTQSLNLRTFFLPGVDLQPIIKGLINPMADDYFEKHLSTNV